MLLASLRVSRFARAKAGTANDIILVLHMRQRRSIYWSEIKYQISSLDSTDNLSTVELYTQLGDDLKLGVITMSALGLIRDEVDNLTVAKGLAKSFKSWTWLALSVSPLEQTV